MFKTKPYVSEKVWGYENWIVSTHKVGQSLNAETDENISNLLGNDYPLLIKLIQANETLSVQVHPEDDYAARVENTYGKTECWYILDAKPNATLVCGLNKDYSREELSEAINNNTLDNCLKYVPVEKGDFVFIPAGTVHAIQGGLRILEIQQPSDITYRLYDWGRPREIHIEKGLDVTKAFAPNPEKPFSKNFSCNYFNLIQQDVTAKDTKINLSPNNENSPAFKTGYITLFVLSGTGTLFSKTENKEIRVNPEDTIIVKSDEELFASPSSSECLSFMKIF
ncbi:MAG: type I phosphomannose isomerase catalytic subunit [Treponemataceae bacterium]|nr:type I phosphomannose isomerase catalytic subunit [Treponemataceae bacterium]